MVRRHTDGAAAVLLAAYLQHVAESAPERRIETDGLVIVLPDRADVVERRVDGRETEITLRIRTAT